MRRRARRHAKSMHPNMQADTNIRTYARTNTHIVEQEGTN